MNPLIINEIDAEIARLQAARKLLEESVGSSASEKLRGSVTRAASFNFGARAVKTSKRRRLSPEARERIRQAQLKRWAAVKKIVKATPAKTQIAGRKSATKRAKKTVIPKEQSA